MPKATAEFETQNASKYLQQLCKHFAHKRDVSFTEHTGQIALPTGPAILEAVPGVLRISVEVDEADTLDRAKHIIDKHLVKFAFREISQGLEWATGE